MARLPRLRIPGVPTHAVVRGNDRQVIFRSEGDRIFFHRCLCEASKRSGLAVHAYVFMTNHLHLLATEGSAGALAETIQSMGRRYVTYFNFLYGRTGTLWEGRYRSSLVQTERYLVACQRYIEMNPVRAGIVTKAGDFPWSSHRHYANGAPDSLVTPHSLLLSLGATPAIRRREYLKLFDAMPPLHETGAIRDALNKGVAIGSDEFASWVGSTTGRPQAPRRPGRPREDAAGPSNGVGDVGISEIGV